MIILGIIKWEQLETGASEQYLILTLWGGRERNQYVLRPLPKAEGGYSILSSTIAMTSVLFTSTEHKTYAQCICIFQFRN